MIQWGGKWEETEKCELQYPEKQNNTYINGYHKNRNGYTEATKKTYT